MLHYIHKNAECGPNTASVHVARLMKHQLENKVVNLRLKHDLRFFFQRIIGMSEDYLLFRAEKLEKHKT